MKTLQLFCVGSRPPAWCSAAEMMYSRQLRNFQLSVSLLPTSDKDKEAQLVLGRLPQPSWVVLLDAEGEVMDSPTFAVRLENWLQRRAPVMVIGGPNGAGDALRERADATLSLSSLTMPHALARVMLMEQLLVTL